MAAPYKNLKSGEVEQLSIEDGDAGVRKGTHIAVHQSRPDQDAVNADIEKAKLAPPSTGGGAGAAPKSSTGSGERVAPASTGGLASNRGTADAKADEGDRKK